MTDGTIYRFGAFEVDDAQLELRVRGAAQVVAPRVLRALLYLLKHRERAVSRDELAQEVWGGLVVSDAALSQTILLARKATAGDGDGEADPQRVIKTVRGFGFRFVADVAEAERGPESAQVVANSPTDEAQPALFGRAREQIQLGSHLALAERGRGSVVLLQGAPGIGKTSLVEALAARAALQQVPVFWGRCWEQGGAPPFWPFIQVLRAVKERFGDQALREWLDDGCRELWLLVPELAPPGAAKVLSPSAVELEAPQAQFRVFDALSRALRRMAHALHRDGAQPPLAAPAVMIALDDLHAADDASVHFLRFLSADLHATPLLMIATFRDLEVTQPCALAALLGEPHGSMHRLSLGALEVQDVACLLRRVLGREVSEHSATQLHALSSGNPFVVSELARYAHGEVELSALRVLRVPERIATAVHRRLEGLSPAERAMLELAAVLGVEFSVEHLRAASARSSEQLLGDLDPVLRNGTLEPVAGSAGVRLRFVHALVRDTLYSELPLARRLSMHRSVAESLEASSPGNTLPLYELAHHCYLAAPAGLADKAVDYARKAAAHAASMMAFEAAASLRDRAIELASTGDTSRGVHWELLMEAGRAWFSAGELECALQRYTCAAEHARDHSDAARFATAAHAAVRVQRGSTLFHPKLTALLEEALAMQAPGDSVPKSLLLGFRGLSCHASDQVAARDAATREAVDMARRLGDDAALRSALLVRNWLTTGSLPPAQARDLASEAVAIARRGGHHEGLLDALFWRMQGHLLLGDTTHADQDLAEYTALGEREHHVVHRYEAQWMHAARCIWTGDFDTSARLADAALARGLRLQEPLAPLRHAVQRMNVCALQGKTIDRRVFLDTVLPYVSTPEARALEVAVCMTAGDLERARWAYEALAGADFAGLSPGPHRLISLAMLSAGCACFDDRPRAQRLYDLLLPHAELQIYPLASWVYYGPVAESLGQLANCLGARKLAASHFERAIALCNKLGARPHLARLRYQYAHTLRAIPGTPRGVAAGLLRQVAGSAQAHGTARTFPLPVHAHHDHEDEM